MQLCPRDQTPLASILLVDATILLGQVALALVGEVCFHSAGGCEKTGGGSGG